MGNIIAHSRHLAQSDSIPALTLTAVIYKEATVVRLIAFPIKKQNKKQINKQKGLVIDVGFRLLGRVQ